MILNGCVWGGVSSSESSGSQAGSSRGPMMVLLKTSRLSACTQLHRFFHTGQQTTSGKQQMYSQSCPARQRTAELCRALTHRMRPCLSPSTPANGWGSSLTCILPELCQAWNVDDIGSQGGIRMCQRDAADQPRPRAPALLLRGLDKLLNVAADIASVRPPPAKFILPFPHSHCRGAAAVPRGRTGRSGWPG